MTALIREPVWAPDRIKALLRPCARSTSVAGVTKTIEVASRHLPMGLEVVRCRLAASF